MTQQAWLRCVQTGVHVQLESLQVMCCVNAKLHLPPKVVRRTTRCLLPSCRAGPAAAPARPAGRQADKGQPRALEAVSRRCGACALQCPSRMAAKQACPCAPTLATSHGAVAPPPQAASIPPTAEPHPLPGPLTQLRVPRLPDTEERSWCMILARPCHGPTGGEGCNSSERGKAGASRCMLCKGLSRCKPACSAKHC